MKLVLTRSSWEGSPNLGHRHLHREWRDSQCHLRHQICRVVHSSALKRFLVDKLPKRCTLSALKRFLADKLPKHCTLSVTKTFSLDKCPVGGKEGQVRGRRGVQNWPQAHPPAANPVLDAVRRPGSSYWSCRTSPVPAVLSTGSTTATAASSALGRLNRRNRCQRCFRHPPPPPPRAPAPERRLRAYSGRRPRSCSR